MPRFKNKQEYEAFMRAKYAEIASALTLQPEFQSTEKTIPKENQEDSDKAGESESRSNRESKSKQ